MKRRIGIAALLLLLLGTSGLIYAADSKIKAGSDADPFKSTLWTNDLGVGVEFEAKGKAVCRGQKVSYEVTASGDGYTAHFKSIVSKMPGVGKMTFTIESADATEGVLNYMGTISKCTKR